MLHRNNSLGKWQENLETANYNKILYLNIVFKTIFFGNDFKKKYCLKVRETCVTDLTEKTEILWILNIKILFMTMDIL